MFHPNSHFAFHLQLHSTKTVPPYPQIIQESRRVALLWVVTPSPEWTINPEELDYKAEWATPDTWKYQLATDYRLGGCTPIMCDPSAG
ncbi:hypothetical protein N7453_008880 [Penicillium expansum]|nr:hypothetical protein N7453_008880 [Penicillium expansum]